MGRQYYIFDTLEQAADCDEQCFAAHMQNETNEIYKKLTTRWCEIITRQTDGKYIVPYCDHLGDGDYQIEQSDSTWFE